MSKGSGKEDDLQAVLIADNFDKRFLTLGRSASLMPICGSTFLDYALEFISFTDVKEVFILTSKESDVVKERIQKYWVAPHVPFKITVFSSHEWHNVGDAIRDLDKKGVIKCDFILLQAGFVCNSNLKEIVQEHRNRRTKDKNNVMTLLFSDCSPNHSSRHRDADTFVTVQSTTNRLLFLQNVNGATSYVNVPIDILLQNENVSTRFDLLDCNVAVCSPQIPPLFSDNFDFETRRDLIREILTNDEILGYNMHVGIVRDKTAVFIGDYHSYLTISQLIMERYCDPLVPDSLTINGEEAHYCWLKRNIYLHKDNRSITKNAQLIKNVVVGRNCRISDGVIIENCVIGDNCAIGSETVLKNCILWNNVKIGSNCSVVCSLICSNVTLGDFVTVEERCVLLKNISIPAKEKIECGTVLSSLSVNIDDIICKHSALKSTVGEIYSLNISVKNKFFWPAWFDLCVVDVLQDQEETDVGIPEKGLVSDGGEGDFDKETSEESDEEESFYSDIFGILKRGYDENVDCANIILEVNCAKPTYNVGLEKLNKTLTMVILDLAKSQNSLNNMRPILVYYLPLLKHYFKSAQAQRQLLSVFTEFEQIPDFVKGLPNILYFLYENDVLSENVILEWHSELDAPLASTLTKFIDWLQQSEEEESSEDD